MKKFLTKGSVIVGLVLLGALGSHQALAQISSTKHNLSSGSTGTAVFSGTAEICVFCHTPHGSDTAAVVPLWNRKMADPTSYITYNSLGTTSLDGATTAVGSVSLACLSCHDGVSAMNVMLNQPGSGGYNPLGAPLAGTWTGTGVDADGKIGSLTSITRIGKDLQNDHPIGIQYGGGPRTATSLPAVPNDYTDFKDPDFNTAKSALLNGQPVWWVETAGSGVGRQKTDMQLYTRASPYIGGTTSAIDAAVAQPYVECATCHDPHSSANPTFLRISNAGSAVCLTCHIK